MQQLDLSSTSCPPVLQRTSECPPAPAEERHWSMGLAPIVILVLGPVTLGLDYLRWKSYDSPWKGSWWDGGLDFGAFCWLALLLFSTVVAIAFGDFARFVRHLFRRPRS